MKCFDVGMKKELILSDEQKKLKRGKKNKTDNRVSSYEISSESSQSVTNPLVTKVEEESKDLMSPECSVNESEDAPSRKVEKGNLEDTIFFGLKSELSNSFHLHCHSRIDKYYHSCELIGDQENEQLRFDDMSSSEASEAATFTELRTRSVTYLERLAEAEFFAPGHVSSDRSLNQLELVRLKELSDAEATVQGVRDSTVDPKNPSLLDIVKMTDHAIRKFINMSKKLTGFRTLCEQDQIALLKGAAPELMILRSVMAYNQENDYWTDANDRAVLKMEVLKLGSKGLDLYAKNRTFIESFRAFRQDKNVMMILGAITLFTPERVNVIHSESVK